MKGVVSQKSEFITEPRIIIPSLSGAFFQKSYQFRVFHRVEDLKIKLFLDISSTNFGRWSIMFVSLWLCLNKQYKDTGMWVFSILNASIKVW